MKRNRSLALILALAMIFGLVGIQPQAYALPATKLIVDGVDLIANPTGVSGVSYDAATSTLTLNGANLTKGTEIDTDNSGSPDAYAVIFSDGDLTVDIQGTNTITAGPTTLSVGAGIYMLSKQSTYAQPNTLKITGTGTLSINMRQAKYDALNSLPPIANMPQFEGIYKFDISGLDPGNDDFPTQVVGPTGTKIAIHDPVVKEGYVFDHWNGTPSTYPKGTTEVTIGSADAYIMPSLVQGTYTVTMAPDSGTADRTSGVMNTWVNLTAPTGVNVFKWVVTYDDDGTVYKEVFPADPKFQIPGKNVTVTAVLDPTYTLTVDAGQGTNNMTSPQTLAPGAVVTLTAPTAPQGYTFDSWDVTGDPSTTSILASQTTYTMPSSNVTLTAKYVQKMYKLTIDPNGGTTTLPLEQQGPENTQYQLVDPTPAPGYQFTGWKVDGHFLFTFLNPGTDQIIVNDSDITLTAQYGKLYKVIMTVADGSATPTEALEGTEIQLTAPTTIPQGKVFTGWGIRLAGNTADNYTVSKDVAKFSMPASDTEVRAIFADATHTLTIDVAPGTTTMTSPQELPKDAVVQLVAPTTPNNLRFIGWTVTGDVNVTELVATAKTYTMPDTNVTLKANYEPLYKLSFDTKGGTPVPQDKYLAEKETTVLPTLQTVPNGARFMGWVDANGKLFNAGTTFEMPNKDTTLTAKFAELYYVDVVNGTGDGWYAAGDIVWIDAYKAPAGEVFYGWHSTDLNLVLSNKLAAKTSFVMPAHPVTLTAWYAKSASNIQTYLRVIKGSGTGYYLEGSKVTIAAEPAPQGYVFDRWVTNYGKVSYSNKFADKTIITPSDKHTTIEATYRPIKETKVPSPNVDRTYGYDRIETAIEVSQSKFVSAPAVVIARADMPFDALAASSFAKSVNAPILITNGSSLDERVAREITRLEPKQVYVLGGPLAISNKAVTQIQKLVGKVTRIAGNDRYQTATLIAQQVLARNGNKGTVIIATGEGYYDALAISSYAAKAGLPVVLVQRDAIPQVTKKFLSDYRFKNAVVVGGTAVISNNTLKALGIPAKRVSGATRFETSVAIANEFFPTATHAFIVSGENFSDALVTGPVSASYNAPILLSKQGKAPEVITQHLRAHNYKNITIIGGPLVVSEYR
ncbi:InlB B-repeat-containing protein [Guggenheimella bovis]